MQPQIMYIERKAGVIRGEGRIGRVSFSDSGKTLYYGSRSFQSLKGMGFKANYFEVDTREEYWISGCKKSGNDSLYPAVVEIDEDVREEYWTVIRECPERVKERSFRSEGKYSRRRPK